MCGVVSKRNEKRGIYQESSQDAEKMLNVVLLLIPLLVQDVRLLSPQTLLRPCLSRQRLGLCTRDTSCDRWSATRAD
jgi:hypothetical protein